LRGGTGTKDVETITIRTFEALSRLEDSSCGAEDVIAPLRLHW
jgi:hypothetical protein